MDLGYVVHTPGELFGTRDAAYGVSDTEWLRRVGGTGWAVIGRDAKIAERPAEMEAYRSAGVHMFLLPGEATRQQLTEVLSTSLKEICTVWSARRPGIWRIGRTGLRPL